MPIAIRWIVSTVAMLVAACATTPARPAGAAPRGHAHNDYLHVHPLRDALARGFTSVEADVFLHDGKLLVGHERFLLRPDRTLERLYLEPLRARVQQNNGRVVPGSAEFLLLVDIKADGAAVYRELQRVLADYRPLLTRFVDDRIVPGAITIVLSGDRPRALVAADRERWMALDGRLPDLDGDAPAALLPLVSDQWSKQFEWDGREPMPDDERHRLRALAATARAQGRLLRFWGAPDRPLAWQELADAGVPLINTDRLRDFAAWAAGR